MNIIRTYVPNSQDNYNHLVFCPKTRQAAAIDPYRAEHLMQTAKNNDLTITQIWVTHEHNDHIKDVTKLKALTHSDVFAPETCKNRVDADHWLADNDKVNIGELSVTHRLSPGHTPGHGIYLYEDEQNTSESFVVCADTLFNAGVGNVYSGDVNVLFATVTQLLADLPRTVSLFPGHDYIVNNLNFVLHYFPSCVAASEKLTEVSAQTPDTRALQTLADELAFNPFLNTGSDWVAMHPELNQLSTKERFIKLRQWRDKW